jgi:AcrR family transcriptional regulator
MAIFQAAKPERLTPRSVATRAKLIAVAERLFAQRGIEAVSLNEINRAGGQRNSNACQYHFGSKEGLLQAIRDKHVLAIVARRNDMLDRMEASGQLELRDVVRAFVYPVAQQLGEADGGQEFIRINAQLIVPHTLAVQGATSMPLLTPGTDRLARVLRAAVARYELPEPIVQQRLLMAAMLLFHGLADHSRMLEAAHQGAAFDTELFVHDLEDSIVALLSAPLSENTRARLAGLEEAAATQR